MLLNHFVVKTLRIGKCANTRKNGNKNTRENTDTRKSCGEEDAHDDCELQSALSCEANKRKNMYK